MKKLFKRIKESKVIKKFVGPAVGVLADGFPFGTTILKGFTGAAGVVWEDKNQDGKVQLSEINWTYASTFIAVALLIRFDIVPVKVLLEAARVMLTLVGGS